MRQWRPLLYKSLPRNLEISECTRAGSSGHEHSANLGEKCISLLQQGSIFPALKICEFSWNKIHADHMIPILRLFSLAESRPEISRFFERRVLPGISKLPINLEQRSACELLDFAWALVKLAGSCDHPNLAVQITKNTGDVIFKRIEARDLNPYQLVDVVEIFSGIPPATVHRPLLLMAYSVLLERHGYRLLPLRHLVRLLLAINACDYRHTVLVMLVAQTVADRVGTEVDPDPRVKTEAFRALAGSYVALEPWRVRAAACQAMLEISNTGAVDEIGEFLVASCHFTEGVDFTGKFIDFLNEFLTFKKLASMDPQTLSGVCVALSLHAMKRREHLEIPCACNMEGLRPQPAIDYKALRVVIKPVDQWKKSQRRRWVSRKIPDLPKLHFESESILEPAKKFPCCGSNELTSEDVLKATRLLCRVFAVATAGCQFTASLLSLPGSDELIPITQSTSMIPTEEQSYLSQIPINWNGERRQNVHWTSCDLIMAAQLLLDSDAPLELLSFAEIAAIKNIITASTDLTVTGHHEFVAGQKPRDEVAQVKSVLVKVAPAVFARPIIQVDAPVCSNFKTDLLVTS